MDYPAAFKDNIKSLLRDKAEDFFSAFEKEPSGCIRVNPLRKFDLKSAFPSIEFTPVPWCADAYFFPSSFKAGKTAAHQGGAYYIQEASATFPVTALNAEKGDKILDLCAAPGGKSTQIAGKLDGTGLLVANEIVPQRAAALSQNIERLGIKNAVVLNEDPRNLENRFEGYFDKILVDAPCSGEGMFRKNPQAAAEWTQNSPDICAARQYEILNTAFNMLREGGVLVYSTCTFNAKENEETVQKILDSRDDVVLSPISTEIPQPELYGVNASDEVINGTVRIMPHLTQGEGHFCARFVKTGESVCRVKQLKPVRNRAFEKAFSKFCSDYLRIAPSADLFFGEYGYAAPEDCPDLDRLKVLRAGVQLGKLTKDRFEPSHSFALSLRPEEVKNVLNLAEGSRQATAYLMGETLPCDFDGWALAAVNSAPLGWGKASGGILKNHLPKGLRINR